MELLKKFESQTKIGKTTTVIVIFVFCLLCWQIYPPLPDYPVYSLSLVVAFGIHTSLIYYMGKEELAKWLISISLLISIPTSYLFNFSYNIFSASSWFLLIPMAGASWLIGWLLNFRAFYVTTTINFCVVIASYIFFGDNTDLQIVHFLSLVTLTITAILELLHRDKNKNLKEKEKENEKMNQEKLLALQAKFKAEEKENQALAREKKALHAKIQAEEKAKQALEREKAALHSNLKTEHKLRVALEKANESLKLQLAAEKRTNDYEELLQDLETLKRENKSLKHLLFPPNPSLNGHKKPKQRGTVIGQVGPKIRTHVRDRDLLDIIIKFTEDGETHEVPVFAPVSLCQSLEILPGKKFIASGPLTAINRRVRILVDTLIPIK